MRRTLQSNTFGKNEAVYIYTHNKIVKFEIQGNKCKLTFEKKVIRVITSNVNWSQVTHSCT